MSTFVHHELNTSDPAAAKKFYKGLFGWTFADMKMPGGGVYTMFKTSPTEGGGIQKHIMAGAPSAWLQYIGVLSVKKAMAKAVRLGATAIVEYMEVPGTGALGIFADPTGATCAVWEPGAMPAKTTAAKKAPAGRPAKKKAAKKKVAKKKAAAKKR